MIKKLVLTLFTLFLVSLNCLKAQELSGDTTVYKVADVKPEFPGGMSRMEEYIQFRLNGEQSPSYDLKEGDIIVEIVVEKNGRIKNVAIIQSLDPMFDENFANIFKGMPKWKPAQKNGQPVRYAMKYTWGMNYYMHK